MPSPKSKNLKITTSERQSIHAWLQSQGVPPGKLNDLVKAGATREELAAELITFLRNCPKKKN